MAEMQDTGGLGGHPDKIEESFREVGSPCGAGPFVGDDPHLRPRHRLAEEPLGKGRTGWTTEPRKPDHEVARGSGEDKFFANQFRLTVDAHRRRCIRFAVRGAAGAIKDIVRAEMDHAGRLAGRAVRQHPGSRAIDRHGKFAATGRFGVVDPRVGRRIQQEVERNALKHLGDAVGLGEVKFRAGEREEFDVRLSGPCLAQRDSEKSASPEEDGAYSGRVERVVGHTELIREDARGGKGIFPVVLQLPAPPLPFPTQSPKLMNTEKPAITAYLKTFCGWSEGVRAIMRKYDLPYEEKDIIKNPAFRWEMEQKSGQPLSPCVVVNDTMLADVSGEEVEAYLLSQGLVGSVDRAADAPTNSACSDEQHAAMARGEIPGAKVRLVP